MATLSSIRSAAIEDTGFSSGLDSAQVTAIAGGVGLSVYSTLDNLPTSGLTSGDQAFVSSTNRFYISNGTGWYNVALINATPTLSINPSGAVILATDGSTPTVITLTGTDSDNADANLVYSVESDGNFDGLATLSQDSSVFTITPLSEDSATSAASTLTFKVSDGISFGSGTTTFTLSFTVADANYTTLLAKADSAGTDNQVDASASAHTITENGNVTSTAFSPYHPGGYSTSFDGVSDYLSFTMTSAFNLTGDFTLECWFNPNAIALDTQHPNIIKMGTYQLYLNSASNFVGVSPDGASVTLQSANSSIALNTWYHVAVVRSGSSEAMFLNGTRVDTNTASTVYGASSGTSLIGTYSGTGGDYNGTIRDLRLVNGTAIYDPSETTISTPTEPLTAVTNTSLLTCHLPYIADGSSNNHTITSFGNTSTKRFSPYDYLGYAKANHGGSVYFDGSGDYLSNNDVEFYLDENDNGSSSTPSNFSFNFWTYLTDLSAQYRTFFSRYGASWSYNLYWDEINKKFTFNINSSGSTTNLDLNFYHSNGLKINQWFYISFRREGTGTNSSTYKLYLNGTQIGGDQTDNGKINRNGSSSPFRIGIAAGGSESLLFPLTGYIADFALKKGAQGVYSPFAESTSVSIAPITSDANTELLTCTNKNDIWDAALGARMAKVGNTTASNTQRQFTTSSAIYFDGTDDNIDISDNTDLFQFGSGDFTIEGWYKADTTSGDHYIIDFSGGTFSAATTHFGINIYQGNWRAGGFDDKLVGGVGSGVNTGIDTTTWHHFALVHASQNLKYYIDGTQIGSTVSTTGDTFNCGSAVRIGGYHTTGIYNWDGYLQDLRITKGLARYTSNFTPPTAEFSG
jgi:hypothetical protein